MLSSRSGVDAWTVRRGPWGVRPVLYQVTCGRVDRKAISLLPILRPGNTGENQSDLCIQIVVFYNARVTLKFLLRELSLASFKS